MGCTSSTASIPLKVVPLPPEATYSYIDKFTTILLMKIRQKFYMYADKETKDLMLFNFLKLYSKNKLNTEALVKIMSYFYDRQSQNITFHHFIAKYATIVKCEPNVFYRIIFEVYRTNSEIDYMNEGQFNVFQQIQSKFFTKKPKVQIFPLFLQQFANIMSQSGFKVEQYQQKLSIITQQEVPLQAINRQMLDFDFNQFATGTDYYLLSDAWFKRWCFYFRDIDQNQHKSTKFMQEGRSNSKKYKQRDVSMHERRLNNSRNAIEGENILFQQPSIIEFDNVEGEYRGQLNQSQNIQSQVKIITENLWNMFCMLHKAEQVFKRVAIGPQKLQYYPKSIYYLEADDSGEFIVSTQQIIQLSSSYKTAGLKQNKTSTKLALFSKNFGQKNWREIQDKKTIGQVSLDRRFFIVAAFNRQKFIDKNFRKEIVKGSFQPGDKVYTHLTFTKTYQEAYIIGICTYNYFKVHFKGYSFRYQVETSRSQLSLTEQDATLVSSRRKSQTIFKGIPNIGNTCFINSIIQSLVATPILDNYLANFPFEASIHPIGYALSSIARSLINNQIPEPKQFKNIIDKYMPNFSGNDQQDAQQFLNLLLDKINDQLKDKPTIIDYLFGGKIQSKLTCNTCKNIKHIQQKMYILSLPVPQAQYNYYSIIMVPFTTNSMKKIVFKLHKNASVAEYCSNFEERLGENKKDYIFAQTNNGNSIMKVKQEINSPAAQSKKVIDVGIVPNVSLLAFEKMPIKYYIDVLSNKPEIPYRDFQPKPQMPYTVCKINTKIDKVPLLQYINSNNEFTRFKADKETINQLPKLGSKSQHFPQKIILRKHNASMKRLQYFGLQMLLNIPRWASYDDIIKLVLKYTENLRQKNSKSEGKERKDYIIRLLIPSKYKCIFCLKQAPAYNLQASKIDYCCEILQKDIPIAWVAKSKTYEIYMDWIDFSKCNSSFCSYLDIDNVSQSIQKSRKEEFVNIESCIKLHSQAEIVEMQCQKCKQKFQSLEHLIRTMPNILILHMKQFRYTPEGHLIKLDLRLKWQEFLDSSKYSLTSNGKLYELYAIVKHSGNSYSGHYTCMAKRKHPFENKKAWVNFDDDVADFVKPQGFVEDAYLLFYKKVDMPTSSLVIYSDLKKA